MIVINKVSQESGNKTTAYFHFTQKSKQAFYSGLALKNKPNETLSQVGFLGFLKVFIF